MARGVELALMGCLAIEVTLDSPLWREVLAGLKRELPPHVLLGVGTVMDETVSQVATAASLGASFALSPIDPVGFVDECHRRGVLAVPSGFSSNMSVVVRHLPYTLPPASRRKGAQGHQAQGGQEARWPGLFRFTV